MATISFQDFAFEKRPDHILVHFLKAYSFILPLSDLEKIGYLDAEAHALHFQGDSTESARNRLMGLIGRQILHLKNKVTGHDTLYVHKNSGIPLIGSLSFGIVDKGSDIMEIKPLTGCNADCIFCSVDEGPSTRKTMDIVVEKDYLVEETKKLLEQKGSKAHIYINPHGEPLLYAEIADLVRDLSAIPLVRAISIITNAMLLTKDLGERLIDAGLTSFNVSLHSLDPEKARRLFHMRGYNIDRVKSTLLSLKGKVTIIIAPVYLKGQNEQDMEEIACFCHENGFLFGMQNFQMNKRGRNPVKEVEFCDFFRVVTELSKKYPATVMKLEKIGRTRQLPKPFHKGHVIEADILSQGRYPPERIGACQGRVITVKGDIPLGRHKIRITKDSYNVFYGIAA